MPSVKEKKPKSDLKTMTQDLRVDIIRMIEAAGSGHPGGSLSVVDLLAVLYTKFLRHQPDHPDWPDRDRFILSKGHACPALYAVMARMGYFPKEDLLTLRKLGSPLQGHPDRLRLPGIEASTGSLGQGLSIAIGLALAAKMDKKDRRVWCVLGDGEMQEGQTWEAVLAAPKFALDNLVTIVDYNGGQIDGPVKEIMDLAPLADKFKAFNWNTLVIDGHDLKAIEKAFNEACRAKDRPTMIVAKTVKGKGVSFMENNIAWHGRAPNKDEADKAVKEIKNA